MAIREALARACADDLEPPLRPSIEIEEFEAGSHAATLALTDLVAHGLATKRGGRRYASYELAHPVGGLEGLLPDLVERLPREAQKEGVLIRSWPRSLKRSGRGTRRPWPFRTYLVCPTRR